MKLLTAAALGLLLMGNANAYNVLIDFEDSPLDGDFVPAAQNPIASRGFNFSSDNSEKGVMYWPEGPIDDSKALSWCTLAVPYFDYCTPNNTITMTQDGLGPFDLLSLDLGARDNTTSYPNIYVELIGYFVGGGSISTVVLVESESLTTFTLDGNWIDLQSVTIRAPDPGFNAALALDNVSVSTVPVPAAVWLFASGLGLLGWMRRSHACALPTPRRHAPS